MKGSIVTDGQQAMELSPPLFTQPEPNSVGESDAAILSYWGLMWWRFKRNRIGVLGGIILIVLYTLVLPAEFTAPYNLNERHAGFLDVPPQPIHFFTKEGAFTI